jgi:uncharacterized protein (TIGR03032 family)
MTGDVDIHDMIIDKDDKLWFIVTSYGCLARQSLDYSFEPKWRPPCLDRIVGEDRCHLNGLCVLNGRPRYVTAVSQTNVTEGWREHRVSGGIVMDISTNEVFCEGLSMPHSPRFYQGKLWLLNSGTGEIGYVEDRKFVPISFCPGFLRGMFFIGDYAVVGSSLFRESSKNFRNLPVEEKLKASGIAGRCGIFIVHIPTKTIKEWIKFEGIITEIYDVVCLEHENPYLVGFENLEINHMVNVAPYERIQFSF